MTYSFLWRYDGDALENLQKVQEENMATAATLDNVSAHDAAVDTSRPAYQAFQILRIAFTIAPLVAGIDKFFHLLVDWDKYLSPFANQMLGGYGHQFMYVVGVVEIIAGIGVFLKPKIFAYIVAIWLALIIVNLLIIGGYLDIALRDLGLLLGAVALGRLSQEYSA